MTQLSKTLKKQAEKKLIKLLVRRSKDISFMQITGLILVICFCYLLSSLHLILPSFAVSYYNDSESFLWNLGIVLNIFTQTTFIYIGTFFRGKTIIYTALTSLNSFLLIGVMPFVFPSQIFELSSVVGITLGVYFLSKKLRNKSLKINSNDPVTALIEQNSMLIEHEHKKIISLTDNEKIKKSEEKINLLIQESRDLINL